MNPGRQIYYLIQFNNILLFSWASWYQDDEVFKQHVLNKTNASLVSERPANKIKKENTQRICFLLQDKHRAARSELGGRMYPYAYVM